MSALNPAFARIFGQGQGAALRKKWFKNLLEPFFIATITGEHRSFDKLADVADAMVA